MKKYVAYYIQSGTNERLSAQADSLEELKTMIYGQAYGPKYGSVTYYTRKEQPQLATSCTLVDTFGSMLSIKLCNAGESVVSVSTTSSTGIGPTLPSSVAAVSNAVCSQFLGTVIPAALAKRLYAGDFTTLSMLGCDASIAKLLNAGLFKLI